MREAAVPGYRLSRARRSTKVLITLGLMGLLLGLLSATILSLIKTGLSPQSVGDYYLGAEISDPTLVGIEVSMARPLAELADVTHLHLMGGSMLLFFLCHLLSLCDVKDELRTAMYVASFTSFLVTFGSPWLIVYAHRSFSWAYSAAIICFIVSLVAVALVPLWEMWSGRE